MTEFRSPNTTAWNSLFVVSLVALVVGGGFLIAERPGTAPAVPSNDTTVFHVQEVAREADASARDAKGYVAKQEWHEAAETLGSSVLGSLSAAAEPRNVAVALFRTEKPIEVAHLQEVPFVAVVEGTYTDVADLISALEVPKVKLALKLIEVTGAESGAGQVRATLGLVAFDERGAS
jgi:hypothetical protein